MLGLLLPKTSIATVQFVDGQYSDNGAQVNPFLAFPMSVSCLFTKGNVHSPEIVNMISG